MIYLNYINLKFIVWQNMKFSSELNPISGTLSSFLCPICKFIDEDFSITKSIWVDDYCALVLCRSYMLNFWHRNPAVRQHNLVNRVPTKPRLKMKKCFERDKCVFHVLTPKNLFLLLRTSLTLNAQLVHLRFGEKKFSWTFRSVFQNSLIHQII